MTLTSIGDMAQTFHLRHRTTEIKNEMLRLTHELSSGKKADLGAALGGNLANLAKVESGLQLARVYQSAASEAALHTGAMQSALETIQKQLTETGPTLLTAANTGAQSKIDSVAADGASKFDLAVSALNSRISGRNLFSGDAPNQSALITGTEMLAALEPLVNAATDAQDVIMIVEDWFLAPGGGFETTAYQGGTGPASSFTVAPGDVINLDISAASTEIRKTLIGFALNGLIGNNIGPGGDADRRALLEEAGTRMMTSQSGISETRARIGTAEERIEIARVRSAATETTLSIEHNRMVGVDRPTTATELEEIQMQLESLLVLTARTARLNLTEFLR